MSRPRLTKDQKRRLQRWLKPRGQLLRRFREAALTGETGIACPLCEKFSTGDDCNDCPLYHETRTASPFGCMDYMPARTIGICVNRSWIEPLSPDSPADRAAVKSWAAKCVKWFEAQREEAQP